MVDQNKNKTDNSMYLAASIDKLMIITKEGFSKTEMQANDFGTLIGKTLFVTTDDFSKIEDLRQHRTKNALRLSTAYARSLFRHSAQNLLDNRQVNYARFAQSDEKIDGASAALSLCGVALKGYIKEKTVEGLMLPDTITKIRDNAFWECTSLTSVNIPDSVTSIGDSSFYRCKSLTSVTIPYSVTSIGDSAFSSCKKLTSVRLPKNVNIGKDAFKDTKVKL